MSQTLVVWKRSNVVALDVIMVLAESIKGQRVDHAKLKKRVTLPPCLATPPFCCVWCPHVRIRPHMRLHINVARTPTLRITTACVDARAMLRRC